ncbi:hypothetical protein [Mesorhizobium sp. CA13]|uniref:hypothetical protein n=1 Tax=Mesorhizobium sp. CA13 TaxID=2876643 RepID=UPI0029623ABC|nr:hypothetical protein [Mesorhizobium sp. CA13]
MKHRAAMRSLQCSLPFKRLEIAPDGRRRCADEVDEFLNAYGSLSFKAFENEGMTLGRNQIDPPAPAIVFP